MKKIFFVACVAIGVQVVFADSLWQGNDAEWKWWFADGMWDNVPGETDTANVGKSAEGAKAFVYLEDKDDVTVANLNIGSGSGSETHLKVKKGAKLTVTGKTIVPKQSVQSAMGTVEVAGGEFVVKELHGSGNNTSVGKIKVCEKGTLTASTSTLGWLGECGMYFDDGTFNFLGSLLTLGNRLCGTISARNNSKLSFAGGLAIGSNVDTASGKIVLDSGSEMTVGGNVNLGRIQESSIVITNSVLKFSDNSSKLNISKGAYAPEVTSRVEIVGEDAVLSNAYSIMIYNNTYIGIHGGRLIIDCDNMANSQRMFSFEPTVSDTINVSDESCQIVDMTSGEFFVTNHNSSFRGDARILFTSYGKSIFRQSGGKVKVPGIYFNGKGTYEPRYEISGGELEIYKIENAAAITGISSIDTADGIRRGIFSIVGGTPIVKMQKIGNYNKAYQPLFDYVICTNGVSSVIFTPSTIISYGWVNGFFSVRPMGGLQLIHSDTVKFIDTATHSRKVSLNGVGTNTRFPSNGLWSAPDATSQITDVVISLDESAELAADTLYENGVSCGYLRLPKIKASWAKLTVKLQLVPQGEETLSSLAEGFTKAGYKAQVTSAGDYNVSVEIPADLLDVGSDEEKILLDFNTYSSSTAFAEETPIVRALVKKIDYETAGAGLVMVIR